MRVKLTPEQKQANAAARKEAKATAKEAAAIAEEKAQKPVKCLTITVEWRKSRMWGSNPTASGRIEYADGTFGRTKDAHASGYGYDKESTVIADVFNQCLRGRLWTLTDDRVRGGNGSGDSGPAPYGISVYAGRRRFSGGIGTGCYYGICEYLGGRFDRIAGGKSFDVYTATFA